MGKKGSWFSAVKKVLTPESREKKDRKTHKSKGWFGRSKTADPGCLKTEPALAPSATDDIKLMEAENEQNKHAYSVALATAVAAEAAVASAKAAAEVVRLTTIARYPGISKEEIAAVKIQSAFRGYMARRALRALKGLVRLRTMIQGQSVKRQATATLRCMQTLARVQSQIRARRIRMSEDNEALQRQLQQKHEKELEKLRAYPGANWNDSTQSKEQVESNLQSKQDAAVRRERALAYAYSHQQTRRNPSKSTNQTFLDPKNPHWGWSWLERWMAARPWELKAVTERESSDNSTYLNSTPSKTVSTEIRRVQSHRDENRATPSPSPRKLSRPPSRHSPSTPKSNTPTSSMIPSNKLRSASTRGSERGMDEDSRSMYSAQSEYQRRHSIASSSIRDDESFASSPALPSYMAPTVSAKAKSRLPSPLGIGKNGTPDRGSFSSTKKRLSFSGSPVGPRRHSEPPKIEMPFSEDVTAT